MKPWQWAAVIGFLGAKVGLAGYYVYARHHGYEDVVQLEHGDVVLDVGAFPSYDFTTKAARKVGPEGFVMAVEPNPRSDLVRRVDALGNAILIEKAAWNCKDALYLYSRNAHSSVFDGVGDAMVVEADTLDSMVANLGINGVDFVKMDIEGAEVEALEGAENILRGARKVVIAAYHNNRPDGINPTHPWVDEFLHARGFETRLTWPGLLHGWRQ